MNENLISRSNGKCELSGKAGELKVYQVAPSDRPDNQILIHQSLYKQLNGEEPVNAADWTFLSESMWSEIPAIQVLSWRLLNHFRQEGWASEALDILYLDEDTLDWAESATLSGFAGEQGAEEEDVHKDAFGNVLQNGDAVVLTKTLDVKGSSISAKQGTVVRNIRLVPDNTEQIEGRVDGQLIVILTKYLRKN